MSKTMKDSLEYMMTHRIQSMQTHTFGEKFINIYRNNELFEGGVRVHYLYYVFTV